MVLINNTHASESPNDIRDEGWWESILADEERFSIAHHPRSVSAQPTPTASVKPAQASEPTATLPQPIGIMQNRSISRTRLLP
jgi:hypothetical protein